MGEGRWGRTGRTACLAQTRGNRPGKKGMDRPNGNSQTLKVSKTFRV